MPSTDWLEQAVKQWITQGGSVLLPTATSWVHAMTLGMICYFAVLMGWDAMTGAPMMSARQFFVVWLPTLVSTNAFLHYYSSPMPWVAVSFHQLIPETARYITNLLNASTMSAVSTMVEKILGRVLPPTHSWDIAAWLAYYAATGAVWLAEGLMFAYGTLSLIALGVGITMGPLAIAMRIWPPMAHWFRNWLDYMVSWAGYGVVLAIVLNMWANALIFGLPMIFHAGVSVEALVLAKAFLLINAALWLSCRKAEMFAAGLFGHAVSGAAGYSSYLRSWF